MIPLGRRLVVIVGAIAALTVVVAVAARGAQPNQARPAQAAVPVQVTAATSGPIRSVLTYSGAIQSSQQVNITPRTSGQIASIRVSVGATVKAGESLATLDPGTLGAQVLQAQAGVQSAQARLALQISGGRAEDISAAQAAFDSAQAAYQQLLTPSPSDVAGADAAVVTAESAAKNAVSASANTRATLIGRIYVACTMLSTFGVPCNNVQLPFPASVTDNIASSLTSGVGQINASNGDLIVSLLTANAAYATAIANVTSTEQALTAAQIRRDALLRPSAAAIAASKSTLEAARATLATRTQPYTEADIQATRATVAQAQAGLAIAQANLEQTVIVAPFDGVIGQKLLDVGAAATPATPVFTLSGKGVELHLSVDEARVGQIRSDQDVELTVPAFTEKTFKGKVATVAPTGDARAHTFDVKVFADDPQSQLKAGMFAQVNIVVAQKSNAILVPNASVVSQTRGTIVFVVRDGKATQRVVKVGVSDATNTEVTDGVVAGEQIVVVGQNALRDGQAVQIATPPAGGGAGGSGGNAPQGGSGSRGGSGTAGGSGASTPAASPTARP